MTITPAVYKLLQVREAASFSLHALAFGFYLLCYALVREAANLVLRALASGLYRLCYALVCLTSSSPSFDDWSEHMRVAAVN